MAEKQREAALGYMPTNRHYQQNDDAEIVEAYAASVAGQVGNSYDRPCRPTTQYFGADLIYC